MLRRTLTIIASLLVVLALAFGLAACGGGQDTAATTVGTAPTTTTMAPDTTATSVPSPSTSELEPIVVPTLPQETPGYTDVDPATGLHMTGTPQVIDLAEYRLTVTGKVDHELSLTYDEIRSLPKVTATPTLVCPGFFEDTATWSGAPISAILQMAGVQAEATRITLHAADGYGTSVSLEDALLPENYLAYELEGEPVPVLHGFPLRAVFPDKLGSFWVKWLVGIEVE